MELICLNSRSVGNGYILTNGKEALIIEAGVKPHEVKKKLDFNISIINGVLVSHGHLDHSKYLKNYLAEGIDVYALADTFLAHETYHHRCRSIVPERTYKAGNFRFMPFEVPHDAPCVGYLINHPHTGTILFVTDTYTLDYDFADLSHILIEANYSDDILQDNIDSGRLNPIVRDRVFSSHIELESCKDILRRQDLSKVQNIVLLHLSDGNSNAKVFKKEIASLTGKPVYVADKGLVVELTRY